MFAASEEPWTYLAIQLLYEQSHLFYDQPRRKLGQFDYEC